MMQCGPVPLQAIKEGHIYIGYDTGFVFDNFQVEEEMSDENSTELNDNDVMKRFNQELESVSQV